MSGFSFKQFHIEHSQCAMKVGTDGVLLGAWADVENVKHILDMGTGTGLIALMLAQRSSNNCQIKAVEIEPNAYAQAQSNIYNSIFADKIQLIQQDVMEFCKQSERKFDLIVANPPYFPQGVSCKTIARNQARFYQQSHLDWLEMAKSCLKAKGKVSFILPFEQGQILAKNSPLFCIKQTFVITKQGKPPQLMLLTFSQQDLPITQDSLVIYNQHNQYSPEFIALTQDFYLKF